MGGQRATRGQEREAAPAAPRRAMSGASPRAQATARALPGLGIAEVLQAGARRGLEGPAQRLPHLDAIQRTFGRHDVRGVQAHTGEAAREGAAAMDAEAFTADGRVAFGEAPSLHTAAHEAAHVVQQRAGIAGGDAWERHADDVADLVVAGRSAAPLLDPVARRGGAPAQGAVQRKVLYNAAELPKTWAQLDKINDDDLEQLVQAATQYAAALDATISAAALPGAWTKVLKSKKTYDLADTAGLGAALAARCASAAKSSAGLKRRNDAAQQVVAPLTAGAFKFQGGARAKVVPKAPAEHEYDDQGREWQSQRHLSTVLFDRFGGEEVQSSFAKDQSGVIVSSNLNKVNHSLGGLTSRADLELEAATRASDHGLATMSREAAMGDRVVRHAMKLYLRIAEHLAKAGAVLVPHDVAFDGQHAEIRIEKDPRYSKATHHEPSGVKAPCLACKLYFTEQGYLDRVQAGPIWLSAVALSTQIEATTGGPAKIDELTAEQIAEIAGRIAAQYAALVEQGVAVGESTMKSGKTTLLHDADSESELDSDEFEATRKQMLARTKGARVGPASAPKRLRPTLPDPDPELDPFA